MKDTATARIIKVADEVWIAAALLHRENPGQRDFTIEEIVARASRESLAGLERPGVYVHVVQHCVANRPPNPGRYRMLFETRPGRRRLFRDGDPYDPSREGSKITPSGDEIPQNYEALLKWYEAWSRDEKRERSTPDPLLSLAGSGQEVWAGETGDSYVKRLREGWE
jgi:hypothetical protein